MVKIAGRIVTAMLFLALAALPAFCEEASIEELVGQYKHATDLQRAQLDKHFQYIKVAASGIVQNVEDWNFFDERKDKATRYYKVTTAPKTAGDGTPYEIIIFYKNKAKVRDLNKGQDIAVEGTFLKIIDQRLIFSVWVYAEDLTEYDKEMFR